MRIINFLFSVSLALIMFSCGDNRSEADSAEGEFGEENQAAAKEVAEEPSVKAVLLWDASIFNASTKDKKWVASYQFGNTLMLTGKEEENVEEKRTYVEVMGPDEKTGWINKNLLAENSEVSVATADIPLYKNPDIMSVSSNSVKAGDILAVSTEEKNGFFQVYGKEKGIKGFINDKGKLSSDANDLKVAVFYQKAMAAKTVEEQVKALQAIVDDGSNASSQFYNLVQNKLYELVPEEVEPELLEDAPVSEQGE